MTGDAIEHLPSYVRKGYIMDDLLKDLGEHLRMLSRQDVNVLHALSCVRGVERETGIVAQAVLKEHSRIVADHAERIDEHLKWVKECEMGKSAKGA